MPIEMSFWFLPNRYLLCTFPDQDHKCESLGVVNMRGLVPLVGVLVAFISYVRPGTFIIY